MMKSKRIGFALWGLFGLVGVSKGQITTQDVDLINQEIFPSYTNVQTYNSITGFQDPNGNYTSIFTTGAGHHTDSTSTFLFAVTDYYNVTPEQTAIADADPLMHLWTYNRQEFSSPEQFADSLHAHLSQYFAITDISKRQTMKFEFYPNPSASGFYLKSKLPLSNIEIYNNSGQRVFRCKKLPQNNTLYLDMIEHPGLYILRATHGDRQITEILMKQ